MPGKGLGNECWTTLVCVDRRQNGDFSGRLYNPYLESGQTFRGLMDFLVKMEELLDLIVNKKEPFDFSYINDYIMKYFGLNS